MYFGISISGSNPPACVVLKDKPFVEKKLIGFVIIKDEFSFGWETNMHLPCSDRCGIHFETSSKCPVVSMMQSNFLYL